jgi:hypothetical protein
MGMEQLEADTYRGRTCKPVDSAVEPMRRLLKYLEVGGSGKAKSLTRDSPGIDVS